MATSPYTAEAARISTTFTDATAVTDDTLFVHTKQPDNPPWLKLANSTITDVLDGHSGYTVRAVRKSTTPVTATGYDLMDREDPSLFFRLVSYRYGRGAMIITTNKSIRDSTELLAGDEVLAAAILDRSS